MKNYKISQNIHLDSLRSWARNYSINVYKEEYKLAEENYNQIKKSGIVLIKCIPIDESEYTNGTGLEIEFINSSQKTIKYIWFTIAGYNKVNDLISKRTVQGVGPLESNNTSKLRFEYVWLTDLIDNIKIIEVKVQYMDSSIKILSKPNTLKLSNYDKYLLFGD